MPGALRALWRSRQPARPGGYALLGVLWICAAAAALAFSASIAARRSAAAAWNRVALIRSEWLAEGCLARARAALAAAMQRENSTLLQPRVPAWLRVDELLGESPELRAVGCAVEARAVGSRLNVNEADEATLSRVLRAAGLDSARADSVAAAIADWKDPDHVPRPLGAERDWYESAGRPPPANRQFTHIAELFLVRGVDRNFPFDQLLDVEPGTISINHAPAAVLLELPGFTPEATEWVVQARAQGKLVRSFQELRDNLSPSAREIMIQGEPRLVATALLSPEAWILVARATGGSAPISRVVELRVSRYGAYTGAWRRRSWIE